MPIDASRRGATPVFVLGLALIATAGCTPSTTSTAEGHGGAKGPAIESPRARAEDRDSTPAASVNRPPTKSSTTREKVPARWRDAASAAVVPTAGRVVALGDLHGDLNATREALRLSGVLGDADQWIGGTTTLVQTGDQLDRGDDEPEILALLERLRAQARAAGGAIVVLNGNHEVMNVAGDLRYVTPGGFEDYASFASSEVRVPPALANAPAQVQGRWVAFQPGGAIAQTFAARRVAAIVGDSLFVHGGVRARWAAYGIDKINEEARRFLGEGGPMPEALRAEDGPLWDRSFSQAPGAAECAELVQVLEGLGVARMVVGHTVQRGGITSACDEKVWRIDVGMSAHYGGTPQALEINDDAVTIRAR